MNSAYAMCLVSDEIKTVKVAFEPFGKLYTYLTILDVKPQEEVVVEVGNDDSLKVAMVISVDDEPDIPENSGFTYKWVLSNMGTKAREEQSRLRAKEAELKKLITAATRKTRRQKMREELLGFIGEENSKSLSSVRFAIDVDSE